MCWPVVFAGWTMACAAGFLAGARWARYGRGWTPTLVSGGLAAMLLCGWVERSPWLAGRFLPWPVHAALEGMAALPFFMLLMGVGWVHARLARTRGVVITATLFGAACLGHAGFWMLATPTAASLDQQPARSFVRQSQSYSCVPAACAIAIHELGLVTTEAEMAAYTHTASGTGSTLIRAAWGLNQRLDATPYRADIVRLDWHGLHRCKTPALALTRFEARRRHMVTILRVSPTAVLIADPTDGKMWLSRDQFEEIFTGHAIVFTTRNVPRLASVE